ncbi:MAG: prepilin peptidase [Ruminococcus sp.]|jgi:leader peptidase (prepilin peptidase)/N-methyltransferase|nr:prepilin peptidase [Ruminococcus sp.]
MSLEILAKISYIGIYIFAFLCGAVIGSFLNVCILRLPLGESLVKKNSHCMTCGAEIKRYDLIPIVSWIILRGKCRNCGAKISPRYMIVESLTAVLFTLTFIKYDISDYGFVFPMLLCFFLAAVIVVAFEDLDTKTMSISVLLWAGAFAVLELLNAEFLVNTAYIRSMTGVTFTDNIIGLFAVSVPLLLIGFVITPLVYVYFLSEDHKERRKLQRRLRAELAPFDESRVTAALKEVNERIEARGAIYGFGMGDVVLMGAAGLMLGYKAALTAAFIGIVLGAVYGIFLKVKTKDDDGNSESNVFAFGPFLCIGIAAAVFIGNSLWDAYFSLLR